MMRVFKSYLVLLLLLLGVVPAAKSENITLTSDAGDKVVIQYSCAEGSDGQYVIRFSGLKKEIGLKTREKYKDLSRIKVVIFDRNGDYNDKFKSDDISTNAFKLSLNELHYESSPEGYYRLDDRPELKVQLLAKKAMMTIPVYLAYYEKKGQYIIFARCGSFDINISQRQQNEPPQIEERRLRTQTITEVVEGEETPIPKTEIALNIINTFEENLSLGNVDIDDLEFTINRLRQLQDEISDPKILNQISRTIERCKDEKQKLEERNSELSKRTVDEESRRHEEETAQQNLAYVKDRLSKIDDLSDSDLGDLKATSNELRKQSLKIKDEELASQMTQAADECDKKINEIENSKKRRNIWLIVGGILLAVLMFVGNQTFQHFRNLKNQKGLEDMQKSIAQRAQSEARRRAQSMVRNRVSRVKNDVRQKGRNMVKDGVNNVVKGKEKNKKGFSI